MIDHLINTRRGTLNSNIVRLEKNLNGSLQKRRMSATEKFQKIFPSLKRVYLQVNKKYEFLLGNEPTLNDT